MLPPPAFSALWQYLFQWHSIFLNYDADRSGHISHSELQNALAAFGIRLSPRLVDLMIHKQRLMQGKIQKGGSLPEEIDFPSFIDLCVSIKQASDQFERLDTNRSGSVQLYWENYMEIIVSGK
jgi:Ca2+-binding EF-hand superfamily protein